MKKILSLILTVVMLMAIVGCQPNGQTPTEFKLFVSDNGAKIPAPVVTAKYLDASGVVRLTWDKVEGAVNYDVYKQSPTATDSDTHYTLVSASTTNLFYYDVVSTSNPMVAGDTYNYIVVAKGLNEPAAGAKLIDGNVEAKTKVSVALATDAVVPAMGTVLTAPTGLTVTEAASLNGNLLYVKWVGVTNAWTYNVYVKSGNMIFSTAFIQDPAFGFPAASLSNNSTMMGRISAPGAGVFTISVVPNTNSDWFIAPVASVASVQYTKAPKVAQVTGETATSGYTDRIEVKFNKVTLDTAGNKLTADATYEIWRAKAGTGTNNYELTTLTATAMTPSTTGTMIAVDTTAEAGINYSYIIVAVNGTDKSIASGVATGLRVKAADVVYSISAPTMGGSYSPTGGYPYTDNIKFQFSKVVYNFDTATGIVNVNATGYDIFRSDDGGTNFKLIAENVTGTQSESVAGNLFYTDSDTTLEKGKSYYYKVRARAAAVAGSYAELISAFSGVSGGRNIAFTGTTGLTGTVDGGLNVTFTWTGAKNIATYDMYYALTSAIPADYNYLNNTSVSTPAFTRSTLTTGIAGTKSGYFDESVFGGLAAGGYTFWIITNASSGQSAVSNTMTLTRP